MSLLIYHYDRDTGEYVKTTYARKDPEGDGYLIPALATTLPPLEPGIGEAPVFRDGAWVLVTDLRGVRYWDEEGQEYEIEELGEEIPPGASTEKNLSYLRKQMIGLLEEEISKRVSAHVPALNRYESILVVAELWPALNTVAFGPAMFKARDVYNYGRQKIAQAKTATRQQLLSYDPATDPNWPE